MSFMSSILLTEINQYLINFFFISYAMFVIIMYVRYDDNIIVVVCDVGGMYWWKHRPINT